MSERWKPSNGEQYWIIAFSEVVQSVWMADRADLSRWQMGNCFKTKEEAVTALKKFTDLLLSLHETTKDCSQLPKLTVEVFDRPDCPKWAKYAVVDLDGTGSYFESKPSLLSWCPWWDRTTKHCIIDNLGNWDASDWQNSLIERPVKLPDWCKVDAIGWHKRCGYFKVTYIDDVSKRVDIQQVEDNSKGYLSFHTVCNETVQAHLRPYSAKEMQGLIGKVVSNERGDMFLVTAFVAADGGGVCVDGVVYDANDLFECYTINGRPCGVLEHLDEEGE